MFPFYSQAAIEQITPPAAPRRSPVVSRRRVSAGGDHVKFRVVYRKGELSKGATDRQWPHQVALPASHCSGRNYVTIRLFCESLSLCPRTHSFRRHDRDMLVFRFAEREHAEKFRDRFGGESIDPKDRPKWPGTTR
jgi:hypothetical protein